VLVDGASADIQRLTRQSASDKDGLLSLANEAKSAQARVDEGEYHISRLDAIINIISDTHARAISSEVIG
jgi:hypothetical protein